MTLTNCLLFFVAPNLSSTEDKARLGAAPPRDYGADPMTESEKQFYENLPFHGMQNPPNKVSHNSIYFFETSSQHFAYVYLLLVFLR